MGKFTLVLFSLLTTLAISAQEVISAQGDSYTNANGSIDFTIGEVITNTGSNASGTITQGFHQTSWSVVSVEKHAPDYEATVYPNPTEDILNIRANAFVGVIYTLYDAQGKLILQGKLSAELTSLEVNQLAAGSYSLTLNNATQYLKTFKLIKAQ